MTRRSTPWPAGTPCWADLAVPDVAAAGSFYSAVLGWTLEEAGPEFGGYVMATVDGAAAAGIGPVQAEGQPAAWTLYFASADADATATAVAAAGGAVVMPPMDVGPLGRMFVAADPGGAVFGVWQSGLHFGAAVANEPGGLTWEDLRSSDPDGARQFYGEVFGFVFDPVPMASADYSTFAFADSRDAPLGGIGGFMGSPAGRPHWLVYFAVASSAEAAELATSNGGTVAVQPFDTPYGPMAGLVDPFGAGFWIVETAADRPQPQR